MTEIRDVACKFTPEGSRTIEFTIDTHEEFPEDLRPELIACSAAEIALDVVAPFAGASVGARLWEGAMSITYCPDLPPEATDSIEQLLRDSDPNNHRGTAETIVALVNQTLKRSS